MVALQHDAVLHFNKVEIHFIDGEDFPLASITEH